MGDTLSNQPFTGYPCLQSSVWKPKSETAQGLECPFLEWHSHLGTALRGGEKAMSICYHTQLKTDTRFLYPALSVQRFLWVYSHLVEWGSNSSPKKMFWS